MKSRVRSPEVEYLENHLRRPLYNINDYGFLYERSSVPPRPEQQDPDQRVLGFRYRKCYRLDTEGRVIALNLANCRIDELSFLGKLEKLCFLGLSNNRLIDLGPLQSSPQLRSLFLGGNEISDLRPLQSLPQLQFLHLGGNQISDLGPLQSLPQLQSLALWGTKIIDLRPLQTLQQLQFLTLGGDQVINLVPLQLLPQLQSLDLGGTKISDLVPLQSLPQLQSLVLSRSGISDLELLKLLPQLKFLNLGGTRISDLGPLKFLPQLQSLDLSRTQISDLEPLQSLPQLQSLDLWGTQISNLEPLQSLLQLQSLDLWGTQLRELVPLQSLPQLQSLDLSRTQISDLGPLQSLPQLQSLDLARTQISDLGPLQSLSQLQSLNLLGNKIGDLSPLQSLSKLRSLDLGGTQISDLSPLQSLSKLQSLDVGGSQISDLVPLQSLPQLQTLGLWGNRISDLSPLKHFAKLRAIDLRSNQIAKISPETFSLGIEVEEGPEHEFESLHSSLLWRGNPIESPAPEVLKRGHAAVQDYFRSLKEGGMEPLREAKVLVVGEAEVGKTSLIKQLLGLPFDQGESKTHDIGRHRLPLVCGAKGAIDLRIWDFGGQEIMHATHQFFLTRRSVYLLVLNSRHNETQCRIEYWLRLIASFGADAPVIVVCNKCDEEAMDLTWSALKQKFPQVRHFVKRVSCYVDPEKDVDKREGLNELRQRIAEVIEQDLPEVGKPMPKPWFAVKAELEKRAAEGSDFLSLERYQKICHEKQVSPGTETTLLNFLHDLGVVLHFGEGHPLVPRMSPLLEEVNVLTPAWVTAAIYKVMNDKGLVLDDRGVLSCAKLRQLLGSVSGRKYAGKEFFILEMMQRFELCFAIPDSEGDVLIPDLLPKEGPDTGEWKKALRFRYQYSVLPQAVIGRFMVRMHQFISGKTYWRYGVVLKRQGIRALVEADLEAATIDIHLLETSEGTLKGRRDFLGAIRLEFERIHRTFSEKLGEKELVPDPAHPHVFESYPKLIQMEDAGQDQVFIENVGLRPLNAFLDGISDIEERRARRFGRGSTSEEELEPKAEKAELTATEVSPPVQVTTSSSLPWWGWSLIYGGIAAFDVALFYWVPWMWLKVCIVVGTVVAALMLFRNPETYWRRTFGLVVAAALGSHITGSFIKGDWTDSNGRWHLKWDPEIGWPMTVLFIFLALGCLVGDWNQQRSK